MHRVTVTVISFARKDDGVAVGSVTGSAASTDQVRTLVEQADAAARAGSAAEDANDLVAGDADPDWAAAPEATSITVYNAFAPALGEAFTKAEAEGRILYGFVDHEVTTTYVGSSTGLRRRHVQPTGHYGCTGKTADLGQSAWVGGATRDFADVDAAAMDATLAQRLAWGDRRVDLEAGRYDTILPPAAVADLTVYAYWTAARGSPTRASRSSASVAAAPGSVSRSRRAACSCSPTRRTATSPARRSPSPRLRQCPERLRQRPAVEPHRLDPGRRARGLDPDPAFGGHDPPADDAGGRQPRARGRRRNRRHDGSRRRHRARPAADLSLVHPRGRSADPAADRPHPRRGLPRRER